MNLDLVQDSLYVFYDKLHTGFHDHNQIRNQVHSATTEFIVTGSVVLSEKSARECGEWQQNTWRMRHLVPVTGCPSDPG